ncbi:MAG: hypothetical protein AMXMBFR23_00050 [Chloroflexota bacterium]
MWPTARANIRHPVDVTSWTVTGPSTPSCARSASVTTDSAIDYLLVSSEMSIRRGWESPGEVALLWRGRTISVAFCGVKPAPDGGGDVQIESVVARIPA